METLGKPANEYVKKKFGEDNNSKILLTTDGIDLTNADVGEKVGDVVNENYETATFSSAGIGLIGIGGLSLSSENNEDIKKIAMEVKEKLSEFRNNVKSNFVEVPLDENGKVKDGFIEVVSRDGKGYVNKKDNGYWEKDRRAGSIFAHGGSYWKRYPSRRDAEKSEKNRITITSGIETENDKYTLKKGKGKVLR